MRPITVLLALFLATAAQAGGDPARGEQLAGTCAACHGPGGISSAPTFPTLAGQYRDYLVEAMGQYKRGERTNPVMMPQATNLSDQDIEDLAAYFASQPGPLYTPRIH